MLPRESIRKTKFFFHKILGNFKSFFFLGEYQKLPRSFSFNPLSRRRSGNAETYTSEQFYHEFYDQWQTELKRLKIIDQDNNSVSVSESKSKEAETENAAESTEGHGHDEEEEEEDGGKEKNKKENVSSGKGNNGRGKVQVLIEKMKEMEMMDVDDVEHLLDIEEALNYYSRLKCPVYLDVVDKFFVEML